MTKLSHIDLGLALVLLILLKFKWQLGLNYSQSTDEKLYLQVIPDKGESIQGRKERAAKAMTYISDNHPTLHAAMEMNQKQIISVVVTKR